MRPALFIRIPRTGSSSIWEAFSSTLAPEECQEWRLDTKYQEPIRTDAIFTNCIHASIRSLVECRVIDRAFVERRFVFTFVRNPWDRLVSLYYLFQRYKRWFVGPFPEFIERIAQGIPTLGPYNYLLLSLANPQVAWLDLGDNREPDFIGRFEHFARDWNALSDLIDAHPAIIHTTKGKNESFRPKEPYQKSYTNQTRDIVARLCAEDIERFGYEFD